jgi:hypothetical protein
MDRPIRKTATGIPFLKRQCGYMAPSVVKYSIAGNAKPNTKRRTTE